MRRRLAAARRPVGRLVGDDGDCGVGNNGGLGEDRGLVGTDGGDEREHEDPGEVHDGWGEEGRRRRERGVVGGDVESEDKNEQRRRGTTAAATGLTC